MTAYGVVSFAIVAVVVVFAGVMVFSPMVRSRTKVVLRKRLLFYKYDYRREWLRFTATLSSSGAEPVHETAIRAVAQIVNSPGGIAWAKREDADNYVPIGAWECDLGGVDSVEGDSSLIRFLEDRQWIIDLRELEQHPGRYGRLDADIFAERRDQWWLIIPMFLGERLYGFIALLRPTALPKLDFEDHDLLKTVGRQVATHIYQAEVDRRLTESKQFGAYNRLTAFLMHDLSNIVAQQSLVLDNAKRFRNNPQFVDDTISTISHSVSRMRRLMAQLTSGSKTAARQRVNVCEAVNKAIERTTRRMPVPVFDQSDSDCHVYGDSERLSMVIEHLLSNAQEATKESGSVKVGVTRADGMVLISIADTGCGMTPEFIRNRLFRPFDSTKGSQGMGIGAYQAREYAKMLGGRLEVTSQPMRGSVFTMHLPLA